MKKIIFTICLAAVCAACGKEDTPWVDPGAPEPVIEKVTFNVTVTPALATKASFNEVGLPVWDGDETIGVALGGYDFLQVQDVQFSPDKSTASFTVQYELEKGKTYNLRIKTPYTPGDKSVVPASQTCTATSVDSRAISMSATVKVSSDNNVVDAVLDHSAAYIRIDFDGIETKDLESVVLSSESAIIADGDSRSVTITSVADTSVVYGAIYPSLLLSDDLSITLNTKAGKQIKKSEAAKAYRAGSMNNLTFVIVFPEGDGSQQNPYQIISLKGLSAMNTVLAEGKAVYFELGADIDMSSIGNWTPLNNTGTFGKIIYFDGKGHTISNLTVVSTAAEQVPYPSFFGVLYGKCSNVRFTNAQISVGNNTRCGIVGGYVGSRNNVCWGVCENVYVQGKIDFTYASAATVGGICGNMESKYHDDSSQPKSELINCHADVQINASNTGTNSGVGGLVGLMNMGSNIINCFCEGSISSDAERVGGIVGTLNGESNLVSNCINWMSEIKGTYTSGRVGAIAGYGGNTTTCPKSYTRADVSIYRNGVALATLEEYGKTGDGKACVHGESITDACATASSAGWNTTVWDLSGSLPVLK